MVGNSQTQGQNQPSRKKENEWNNGSTKQKLILWEYQQSKPLSKLTKGHRYSMKVNKISKEKGDIVTETE